VQRGDLDVEVELHEVEVRGEALDNVAVTIPPDVERRRLVLPTDLIEVEQARELTLGCVREADGVALQQGWCERLGAHGPPAAARRFPEQRLAFAGARSTSSHPRTRAIAKPPPHCASR